MSSIYQKWQQIKTLKRKQTVNKHSGYKIAPDKMIIMGKITKIITFVVFWDKEIAVIPEELLVCKQKETWKKKTSGYMK